MKFLRWLFGSDDPPAQNPMDIINDANKRAAEAIMRHRQLKKDVGVLVPEYIAYEPLGFSAPRTVEWMLSENGNKFFERAGKRITVYQDMRGSRTLWKFCSADEEGPEEPFFSNHYFTEDDAAADALRFHFLRPMQNNTYQAQREGDVREAVPALIAAERKRLSELLEKVERGRSKKGNLLRDAQKRLQQTEHLHHVALMADTQDQAIILAVIETANRYREIILLVKEFPE